MTGSGDATWLYLVRHGATEANERIPYILQGCGIDLPLSAAGEKQAAAVASLLKAYPIRHVYSSRMVRAQQTARAIAQALELELNMLDEIHECDVGRWEGMDWETIRREFPDAHDRFKENPEIHPNLGGESYGDVLTRARPVVLELLQRHAGESIALVAHNVVNRVLLADLLGIGIRRAAAIRQANGCVNLIRYQHGAADVVSFNAQFHLAGVPG
jgi:broad specificity phosphatase PhoE